MGLSQEKRNAVRVANGTIVFTETYAIASPQLCIINAYTSVFWHCWLVSVCACRRIELRTCNDRPHPSQRANSSCIKSLHAILALLEHRHYRTIETGMIENRLSRLLLRDRLSDPLSIAREHDALCASALGMHLHDHHVCAHGSTVLTNPEHSESASSR